MRTRTRFLGAVIASATALSACASETPDSVKTSARPRSDSGVTTTVASAGMPGVDAATAGVGGRHPAAAGASTAATGKPVAKRAGVPIRIATVGTMSGPGAVQQGTVTAVQAWAKMANDAGGLHGHPVEVDVVDDGGDAARFRTALQDEVVNRKVIAFVGNLTGFSLSQGAVEYLEQVRVPMVGGDRLNQLWNESPMLFPQASAGLAAFWIHVLYTARLGGKGAKLAFLTCTEAQQCADADAHVDEYAAELGLDLVYKAKASLVQPKFATECLRAKQAGADYFIVGLDPNGNRRIAQSCHEQDYHPRFEVPQTASAMAQEPGLQSAYHASATFPWVSSATPAMVEFHHAMARYAPKAELSAHFSSGWTAAKLFERAAANITDAPTSAQILEGLWTIKSDTLGGLTAPLTFVREKAAPPVYCFFGMEVRSKAWVATSTTPDCQAPRG